MKIAVLGGGAMGALYGGYLSRKNDVTIVDVNTALIEKVRADGLKIAEPDGSSAVYHPAITSDTKGMQPVDLVIVFVKAMFSESALENNRALIGPDTYLMTLQNGSGHEDVLKRFADDAHVVIGTTQHNSAVVGLGEIRHGGSGMTHIGGVTGGSARLQPIADAFTACGLEADCVENVQKLIWQK
ncbi:MAG: ketopantoate reductase family protein, partial [Christensenellales bacterium]